MRGTSYAISWLYGEFRIARMKRGTVDAFWQSPSRVNTTGELQRALQSAGEHIDLSTKGDVTIVHEHDLHTHEYLEVPAMKRRDLEKLLSRRVKQNKSGEESAWCYHEVSHAGGKKGVLLHQLPKRIVTETVEVCTQAGLTPKRYIPLTEIASDYLPRQELPATHIVLVVACFDERVELIVTLGDGEAIFVRELSYGARAESAERLVTDINRTIRYVKQQLGRGVDIVWTMGHPDWEVVDHLRNNVGVPVNFDAETADGNFWCESAIQLSGKLSANFISVFAQNNLTIDVVKRWGVYATASVATAALLLTVITTGLVANRGERIDTIDTQIAVTQATIEDLRSLLDEGKDKQLHLERLRATSHNLPSLMLQHFSTLTPADATLTHLRVRQEANGWTMELRGSVRGDMRHGARVLANLEQQLAGDPWRVHVSESFRDTWMEQLSQGRPKEQSSVGFDIRGELK